MFIGEARERALFGHMLMINFIFHGKLVFGLGRLLSYARALSACIYTFTQWQLSLRDFFYFILLLYFFFVSLLFNEKERKIAIFALFRKNKK